MSKATHIVIVKPLIAPVLRIQRPTIVLHNQGVLSVDVVMQGIHHKLGVALIVQGRTNDLLFYKGNV